MAKRGLAKIGQIFSFSLQEKYTSLIKVHHHPVVTAMVKRCSDKHYNKTRWDGDVCGENGKPVEVSRDNLGRFVKKPAPESYILETYISGK